MNDRPAPPPPDGLRPFYVMEIHGRAKQLEAEGRSICYLVSGEPGAPPAPKVREAVAGVLDQPQNYTHFAGIAPLRQALSRYYADQHRIDVTPEEIIATTGSSGGFVLAFLAGFAPRAKIAVTRPGYPAYLNALEGLGYRPVEIPLTAEGGWRLSGADIEAAYAREAFDGLLFASPANPTGAAVTREGLHEIIEVCARLGIRLISDEIYHGLDYRGPSTSALEFSRDVIVVNSFSKYHCMSGWRIGWMVVPEDLRHRTEMLQQNLFISAPTLSQVAAVAALGERDYAEAQKASYAVNRQLLSEGLSQLGLDSLHEPDGAFYAYVDFSKFTNDSMTFCKDMLEAVGVAATPGVDFDRVNGDRFIRFSYAGTRQTIEEGLERMRRYLG